MSADTNPATRHWDATRWLTAALLSVWFVVAFCLPFFARTLDARFAGWPLGFWVSAQGALVVYIALIALYAWTMERLDERRARAEVEAEGHDEPVAPNTAAPPSVWSQRSK